ncbi:MAG: M20/M25/M40 family metallo-hydrolase [Planctomycetales bacterium]
MRSATPIRFGCLLCLLTAGWASADAEHAAMTAATRSITSGELQTHVNNLANDSFEGRQAGTRGGRAAGVYLRAFLEKHGLKPAGDAGGYFQRFHGNCRNIIGIRRGSDPALARETIVIGAHYDHVGYGSQENSAGPIGYIHNGADDNASGTAALLEIMEAFAKLGPPRRSVLFALWASEENGLHGSKHWVSHPTVPLSGVKLMINMDMVGRLRDERVEVYGTRTAAGLRELVSRGNLATGLTLDFSWEIKENSDHYSFLRKRIPALMMHTGLHDDYHRPSDDAHRINAAGMERVSRLTFRAAYEAADRPALSGFRSRSLHESPASQARLRLRRLPALPRRLGVNWKPGDAERDGLQLIAVAPNSAAARAGLVPGNVIVGCEGEPIRSGLRFQELIMAAPAEVVLSVRENAAAEESQEAPVQLDGGPIRVGLTWREDDAEPNAAVIQRVVPRSPAARAGVRVGDRVLSVSGQSFADRKLFRDLLIQTPGPLELELERQGRIQTLQVKLVAVVPQVPDSAPEAPSSDEE